MSVSDSDVSPGLPSASNGQAGQAITIQVDMNLTDITSDTLPSHAHNFGNSNTHPNGPPEPLMESKNNEAASDINKIFSESLRHKFDDDNILFAATLVRDAKSNRFLDFKSDKESHRLYTLYHHPAFKYVQYLAIFIILGLACFEEPAMWPVEFWACQIVELIMYCYLGFRVIHLASFQHKTTFWKDKKNATAIGLIALCIIDIIVYSIWISLAPDTNPVRWSRPLRPLFIINFPQARQIRRAFRNIRRTLIEIVFVLILFFFSIMIFALMALKLFDGRKFYKLNGDRYFSTYGDALWDLYVLVTTANNPDVMMPAYDASQWYALFFVVFLIVNLYVFMNVLLAVIFNSYKSNLKNEVRDAVYNKRKKLAAAYDVAKEPNADNNGYFLSFGAWAQIIKTMNPKMSADKTRMLFQVMDGDGDGQVTKAEFLYCADLLNIPLTQVKDRMILWERLFPRFFNSAPSKGVRLVVLHSDSGLWRFYRYFFDFAIVVNAVFIAVSLDQAEWFFLALFTLEILLNLYVYGPWKFIKSFWNIFDVLVIGGAMIATIAEGTGNLTSAQGDTLDFILVMRVLRLIKIVNGFQRFKVVVETLVSIGPSILIYGGVVFVFYYSFAIVGMEVFAGKFEYFGARTYNQSALPKDQWYCDSKNDKLKDTDFYALHYCSNNFNDFGRAFVVLTELTVVNQWHVLVEGFETVTHPAVRLYFVAFHLMVVVLVMNIFIAFILEAFLLEYSLSKSKFESIFEAKILKLGYALGQKKLEVPQNISAESEDIVDHMEGAAEEGPRFHVKQSRRKVEVLLQRMFEDELDPEDIGADEGLAEDDDKPPRKYTFDMFVST